MKTAPGTAGGMKMPLLIIFLWGLCCVQTFPQPVPDCSAAGFAVQTKRYNLEPRDWTDYSSRTVCQVPGFNMGEAFISKNAYGSRTDRTRPATGYFHTEKINGRWWIIDPQGYLHFDVGVCSINKNSSPRNTAAFASKYSNSTTAWMRDMKAKLKNYGFYTAGAWTTKSNLDTDKASNPMPYTPIHNFLSTYHSRRTDHSYISRGYGTYASNPSNPSGHILHVFDPEFEAFCRDFAERNLAQYASDRDVLGIFSDNELPFNTDALVLYLKVTDTAYPGYAAAKKFVEDAGFTAADVVAGKTTSGASCTLAQLKDRWTGLMGEKYYATVREAIKAVCPNHMYIGSRLHLPCLDYEGLVKAAMQYLDIVSFNTYKVWSETKAKADFWATRGDKPFLVTEFYAKGEDVFMTTGEKFPNQSGSGYIVNTQKERGYFYQTFCLGLLEAKNCVGWHHFKYMDNDPEDTNSGADPSNIDSNKGLVDNDYDFYTGMVETAKELNDRVYNLIDFFDNTRTHVPDAGLKSVYPEADANYQNETGEGTQENLEVKAKDPYREAIVRFDLSSLPSTDKLDYAGFKLTATRTITDQETNIYAIDYVADNQWTETGIRKSTMPASSPENYPWRAIYSWNTNTGVTVNVTHYVKKALSQGITKISFKIRVDTQGTNDYMSFGARENADVNKRPALLYAEKSESGMESVQAGQSFSCYPNPSKGTVYFRLDADEAATVKINIYTPRGELYKQVCHDGAGSGKTTVPAVVENKGVYIVRAFQDSKALPPVKLVVN